MKQTPDKILNDILRNLTNPGEYTYIIMGKPGPTGKTWLCDQLKRYGYNACEITESVCWLIEYNDNGNHYLVKKQNHVVVIILNAPIEPVKEMTLEEIEKKLGHKVKIVRSNPIKDDALCKSCAYGVNSNLCGRTGCADCKLRKSAPKCGSSCPCLMVRYGEPCPYYEEDPNNA